MQPTDAFFTQTVVGAPFSTELGRPIIAGAPASTGLEVDVKTGDHRLARSWQDWFVLSHAGDSPGTPRARPGPLRRFLERHALSVAVSGLLAWGAAAATAGWLLWK